MNEKDNAFARTVMNHPTWYLDYRRSEQTQSLGFLQKYHAPQVQQEQSSSLGNTKKKQPSGRKMEKERVSEFLFIKSALKPMSICERMPENNCKWTCKQKYLKENF